MSIIDAIVGLVTRLIFGDLDDGVECAAERARELEIKRLRRELARSKRAAITDHLRAYRAQRRLEVELNKREGSDDE